jgi:DNA-binding beta-propeller fold protein YncE
MSDETPVTPEPVDAVAPVATAAAGATIAGAAVEERKRRRLLIWIVIVAVILALILGAFAWYLITRKPITQIPIFSQEIPPTYSAAVYDVSQPLGVAIDEENNRVYVTQSSGSRTVAVFDLEGNRMDDLVPGGRKAKMHLPAYVAVDPATKEVYVTDRASATVYVYDSTGAFAREFKPTGKKGWNPLGITFAPDGTLYVSDVTDDASRIWQLKTDGTIVREMGQDDSLTFVNGLAVQPDGSLVATDSNTGRVLVYTDGNKAIGSVARGNADAPMGLPRGAAVDDRGRVYVVDTVNHTVRVYVPSDDPAVPIPVYAFSFGEEGANDGAFEFPNGVATDSYGKVYVTDRENNRVQVWSYR